MASQNHNVGGRCVLRSIFPVLLIALWNLERPTCLFLAAKTTNYPVPVDQFVTKIAKLNPADVLDTEFLVAQSLGFEFWVRGAEKALRGWNLELQVRPS